MALPATTTVGFSLKVGEGVTGWVAEHRSPVALSSKAFGDARFKRFPILVEDTYAAFLSVPLVSSGELIGVINVHHRDVHEHSPEEISLVTFMGEQMGSALGKAKLLEQNAKLAANARETQGSGAGQGSVAAPS